MGASDGRRCKNMTGSQVCELNIEDLREGVFPMSVELETVRVGLRASFVPHLGKSEHFYRPPPPPSRLFSGLLSASIETYRTGYSGRKAGEMRK